MNVSQKTIRVLLVEDDDFTRNVVREMLVASGIEVHNVASVAQAIESRLVGALYNSTAVAS